MNLSLFVAVLTLSVVVTHPTAHMAKGRIDKDIAPELLSKHQDKDEEARRLWREQMEQLERKAQSIRTELGTLKEHPWAGEYSWNIVDLATRLYISPQNGAAVLFHSDIARWGNHGKVIEQGRHLSFHWIVPQDDLHWLNPRTLLLVRWGDRRYLIPSEQILEFCLDAQDLNEPRPTLRGHWWLRKGDETKATAGIPDLPKGYERYWAMKPIQAAIVSLGAEAKIPSESEEWEQVERKVVLNAGSIAGVLPHMQFEMVDRDEGYIFLKITVTHVRARESEGILKYSRNPKQPTKPPVIGWKFVSPKVW